MKIISKRIPKGSMLLILSFAAVSLCFLLIISATRAQRENNLSKNNMYSGHQKAFYIRESSDENQWEEVIPSLASSCDNFSLSVDVSNFDIMLRGVCVKGKVNIPPMMEGEYFDLETSWTTQPKAVIGKKYQDDVIRRDGVSYYTLNGVEFEVIGVMGTKMESRINQMVVLDFKSAVKMAGINTSYNLDTQKTEDVIVVGREMSQLLRQPAQMIILLTEEAYQPLLSRLLSSDAIMDTMYLMIVLSFALSTILVTFIWLRLRRQLFFAWRLAGYERKWERAGISKRYYLSAGIGFAVGFVLMMLLSLWQPDISLVLLDVLMAFVITIGLGTGILFFCYMVHRRKF